MQQLRYHLITRPSDPNVFVYRADKYPNMLLLLLWSTDTDISDACIAHMVLYIIYNYSILI